MGTHWNSGWEPIVIVVNSNVAVQKLELWVDIKCNCGLATIGVVGGH